MKLICISLLLAVTLATYPVAVFHGMGDECNNLGMKSFTKKLGVDLGVYTVCLESGGGAASIATSMTA